MLLYLKLNNFKRSTMKKFILLFICIATLSSFIPIEDIKFSIVGKWVGEKDGDKGALIFDKDGYISMEENGQTFGGKGFVDGNETFDYTYKIDYSKKPIEFDLVNTRIIPSKEVRTNLAIIEIINNDKIKICFNVDGTDVRPTEFTEENTVYFTKEK